MTGRFEYAVERFEDCLRAGYIDSSIKSDSRFSPRLVTNNSEEATSLLTAIRQQFRECSQFDFSVAFIADSGLQTLIEVLNMMRDKEIPGRFLSSTYLNFNNPNALRKLLEYPNIEARVFQGNMHAKGYFFSKGDYSTIIIGSSNLTQAALTCNKEWNVLFHSFQEGEMLKSARREFEALWESEETAPLTEEWIAGYERQYQKVKGARINGAAPYRENLDAAETTAITIKPNQMQSRALASLEKLHDRKEPRALLISATGTGKTYLAALDVAATQPHRVLFIAHRHRILQAAEESFRTVLGNRYTYGIYGAGATKPTASCVFAMVSTLSKHLDKFDPHEFDYIIIDEAHRVGANSYIDIMEHFRPSFYLGMTATPLRTDGYDVFGAFNHTIAHRITLQDALGSDMLTPFHYFGIADLDIDDNAIDDFSLFSKLSSDERVRHITGKIEEYSIGRADRKGLVFCNRNEEACVLSERFNELGYKTVALSGSNNDSERDRAIAQLESGEIEYIFTVDIFNEGIDIPSVNQIVMLRRTESAIVFVQQLGRGLRKANGKEYTLVLDFIGDYQKNYFVPIALSGDRTYNKDSLRVFVKEGSTAIPGCSTISFDRISEARIFRALDENRFGDSKLLRDEYENLRQSLGRIPGLLDFDANEAIDPLLIFKKYGSYHSFLEKYERDYSTVFSKEQCDILKFISQKIANGKRLSDLLVLKALVESSKPMQADMFKNAVGKASPRYDTQTLCSTLGFLSGRFTSSAPTLIQFVDGEIWTSPIFTKALTDLEFKRQLIEVINFGLSRNRTLYSEKYKDTGFVLDAKYTYEEVCRILNWSKNVNGQNIGGYKYDKKTNTFPVFINYDKDPSIDAALKYEDRFVSDREIIAISKQPRTMKSPEIERLIESPKNGMRSYLFVRKNKDDKDGGKEFYFLGEMHPTGFFKEITMPGTTKAAIEIGYYLEDPVRADLYDYLMSSLDESEVE